MSNHRVIPLQPADEADGDDETDRRIARLTQLARDVFRRKDKAERWLRRPRRDLGDISPLEMMETPAGARQVELMLRSYSDD